MAKNNSPLQDAVLRMNPQSRREGYSPSMRVTDTTTDGSDFGQLQPTPGACPHCGRCPRCPSPYPFGPYDPPVTPWVAPVAPYRWNPYPVWYGN